MTTRSKDAVAALHEAADCADRASDEHERRARSVEWRKEVKLLHEERALCAAQIADDIRTLADAPDPLAEAREIVRGMSPWKGHDGFDDRMAMWTLTVEDYDALRRALEMEE